MRKGSTAAWVLSILIAYVCGSLISLSFHEKGVIHQIDPAILPIVSNCNGNKKNVTWLSKQELEKARSLLFHEANISKDLPVPNRHYLYSFEQANVVARADWFPEGKRECKPTCCVQKVAISLDVDEHQIVSTVDGLNIADVKVIAAEKFGHDYLPNYLTSKILPCLKPGTIIYADSNRGGVTRFFEYYRPNITVPFILITGEYDGYEPRDGTKYLGKDPLLLHWYGINPAYSYGADHPNFHPMFLGVSKNHDQQAYLQAIDKLRYHQNPFAGEGKKRWTESKTLREATDTAPVLSVSFNVHKYARHRQKWLDMACTNRTASNAPDQTGCGRGLPPDAADYPNYYTYVSASKYLFGLSPPGLGYDCYRTYEYLLLGVIPILQWRPEGVETFEGLPVIFLKGTDHSQQDLLKIMRDYVRSPAFLESDFPGWQKLYLKYWRQTMLRQAGRAKEIVEDENGRKYYTHYTYTDFNKPYIGSSWPPDDGSLVS